MSLGWGTVLGGRAPDSAARPHQAGTSASGEGAEGYWLLVCNERYGPRLDLHGSDPNVRALTEAILAGKLPGVTVARMERVEGSEAKRFTKAFRFE